MTRNLRDIEAFQCVQVTNDVDYNTMSMTQRPWRGVSDIANYQLFPGEPRWEKNT